MNKHYDFPKNIFILIPAYKSCESLKYFLPQLIKVAPSSNICVVDDGSFDGTEDVAKQNNILYLSNSKNFGKGAALKKGFNYLIEQKNADWIITMDADGQHSIDDIFLFIDRILNLKGIDLIIGRRSTKIGQMPLARIFSNRLTSFIISVLAGQKIFDIQCGFRAYSKKCIKNIVCIFNRFEMETEIVLRACAKKYFIDFVPIKTLYFSNQSHISHFWDTLRWLRTVIFVYYNIKFGEK